MCHPRIGCVWGHELHPRKRRKRAPVLTGVRGRRPGVWLRRTGRDTCAYRGGTFPIAAAVCVLRAVCRRKSGNWSFKKNLSVRSEPILYRDKHGQSASRGHEASPQSGLGVSCKLCSSSKKLRNVAKILISDLWWCRPPFLATGTSEDRGWLYGRASSVRFRWHFLTPLCQGLAQG